MTCGGVAGAELFAARSGNSLAATPRLVRSAVGSARRASRLFNPLAANQRQTLGMHDIVMLSKSVYRQSRRKARINSTPQKVCPRAWPLSFSKVERRWPCALAFSFRCA